MSITMTIHPLIAALLRAEEMLGVEGMGFGCNWNPSNPQQEKFLEKFYNCLSVRDVQAMKEIVSIASKDVNALNNLLKEQGFDIQLEPFGRPDSFGIVSIMKIMLEWYEKGKPAMIISAINPVPSQYQGIRIPIKENLDESGAVVLKLPGISEHVVVIRTKDDGGVIMCMSNQTPKDGFDLIEKIQELMERLESDDSEDYIDNSYGGIIFPKVNLNQKVDISWLKEMEINDSKKVAWFIAQALQQTKFEMDEVGAKVESAVAVEMQIRSCISATDYSKPDYAIDQPFFLGIANLELSEPLLYAYITEKDWVRV